MLFDLLNAALLSAGDSSPAKLPPMSRPLFSHAGSVRQLAAAAGAMGLGLPFWRRRSRVRSVSAVEGARARLRNELIAYLLLDLRFGSRGELARQVSRVIAGRSAFDRVALLLREPGGTLSVAGSTGMDDLSLDALNRWAESAKEQAGFSSTRRGGDHEIQSPAEVSLLPEQGRAAGGSFRLLLHRRSTERGAPFPGSCRRVIIVPMHTTQGLIGAFALGAEPRPARTCVLADQRRSDAEPSLSELLQPVESLALRLTLQLPDLLDLRRSATSPRQRLRGRAESAGSLSLPDAPAEVPAQRRALDAADAPNPAAPVSPERLLEIVGRTASRPVQRVSGCVSGRPPARLWSQTSVCHLGAPS